MSEHHYLFVDGGYLRSRHSELINRVFGEASPLHLQGIRNLNPGRGPFHRVFYYDCLHDIPKVGETEEQLKIRVMEQQAFFDDLQTYEGFHVRLGSLSGSSRKFRQKEVDILLAVDALEHAFRKNLSALTLIAGDLDFVPLVDSLVRSGTWVEILYDQRSFAKRLLESADKALPLEFHSYYGFCSGEFRTKHQLPTRQDRVTWNPAQSGYQMLRSGTFGGQLIQHFSRENEHVLLVPQPSGYSWALVHKDPVILNWT